MHFTIFESAFYNNNAYILRISKTKFESSIKLLIIDKFDWLKRTIIVNYCVLTKIDEYKLCNID